jgi:hypothetical protein
LRLARVFISLENVSQNSPARFNAETVI